MILHISRLIMSSPEVVLDKAVESVLSPEQKANMSPEQIGEIKERARAFIQDPEKIAGMRDLRKLTILMGLRPAGMILKQLIRLGPSDAWDSLRDRVDAIADMNTCEHGCQTVDFYNKSSRGADRVHLMLDECGRTHDLTGELNKLLPHIDEAKKPQIMKHLSMLIGLGRSVYVKLAEENKQLFDDISAHIGGISINKIQVDPANTTMYVVESTPMRVGIFVRRDPPNDQKSV